ncbi:unnamed protein product [Toxocara canis]|uniref:Uncharacterized protein n=1 Tax=Toxocara canis TaxID=6265 RepID=A0A183UM13_TOXCA|nr:unnamed protein product [Toxocara canis]
MPIPPIVGLPTPVIPLISQVRAICAIRPLMCVPPPPVCCRQMTYCAPMMGGLTGIGGIGGFGVVPGFGAFGGMECSGINFGCVRQFYNFQFGGFEVGACRSEEVGRKGEELKMSAPKGRLYIWRYMEQGDSLSLYELAALSIRVAFLKPESYLKKKALLKNILRKEWRTHEADAISNKLELKDYTVNDKPSLLCDS